MNLDNNSNIGETGTKVVDSSTYEHNGTLVSAPPYVSGVYGTGLSFTADADYVNIPDSPDFTLGSSYSVMTWINPDDQGTQYKGFMGTYSGSSNGYIFTMFNSQDNI